MPNIIFDIIKKRADLSPEKIALKEIATQKQLTFKSLNSRAAKFATILLNNEVSHGDRVAIICRNRIEFFEGLFACAKIGAILVPLNWRSPAPELLPLIANSRPKLILFAAEDELVTDQIKGNIKTINLDTEYDNLVEYSIEYEGRDYWSAEETWYLLYTSGTTGTPKAVIQTYGMALVNAINLGQAIDIRADDKFLNFLPLFHTAGINLHTLPAIWSGCTSLVLTGFDVETVIGLIEEGAITCFFGVPAVYLQIAKHENFHKLNLAKIRHWGCGGAPLPDYLVAKFANAGALVCNGMGMTETGPTAFMMDSQSVLAKIGSVGKPQILINARVIDANFDDVRDGQSGELVFTGPGITPGYWQNESANREAFHFDEKTGLRYLKTGDLARKEDGYFYITGRAKEMYISGGENVYPAEVENILALHDAISEVAIIGVKDEKWGEVGLAFYISNAPNPPSHEELSAFCRARLAAFKIPRRFIQVDDFARTAAGKIQKHLIEVDKYDV